MSETASDPERIARRIPEDVASEGDVDLLSDILTEDFAEHSIGDQTDRGIAAMKAQIRALRNAFPDFEASVESSFSEDDMVAMYVRLSGTHEGPFMGIEPTGEEFAVDNLVLTRVADGKIAERWVQPDVLAMFEQLGVDTIPPGTNTAP